MSKFPTSLSFPIQKVKEMIAEIENDRNNPKASTNKTIQKRMSKKRSRVIPFSEGYNGYNKRAKAIR